jgi:K+-sensing histidine kinase KdpD
VDQHGGSIQARSAGPGKGSTFVVRLPLRQPDPRTLETHDRSAAATVIPSRAAAAA